MDEIEVELTAGFPNPAPISTELLYGDPIVNVEAEHTISFSVDGVTYLVTSWKPGDDPGAIVGTAVDEDGDEYAFRVAFHGEFGREMALSVFGIETKQEA